MLPRKFHHAPLGVHTCRTKRLILMVHQLWQFIHQVRWAGKNVIRFGRSDSYNILNISTFIKTRVIEAGGKGLLAITDDSWINPAYTQ